MSTLIPGAYAMVMKRGSAFGPIEFAMKDGVGAVFALTGYGVECFARAETPSPNQIDLRPVIPTPADGVVKLVFTDEEVEVLLRNRPDGQYLFDLVLINPTGDNLPPTISDVLTVYTNESREF